MVPVWRSPSQDFSNDLPDGEQDMSGFLDKFPGPSFNFKDHFANFKKPSFSFPKFQKPLFKLPKFQKPSFKLPKFQKPSFNFKDLFGSLFLKDPYLKSKQLKTSATPGSWGYTTSYTPPNTAFLVGRASGLHPPQGPLTPDELLKFSQNLFN